ncbi:MAG: enoyl-(acyl-carrier protein) reductase [Symbiobacteriaceae bacterium]|jgi:enoyl-[acyl-carrier protein] reductase I|nr:enoyl-(acyl-carrier protein) reductase [Symbiobacteriaceae bacterium]
MGLLTGKKCLVMGIANKRSIAWGITQALHREGAELAFTYPTERLKENVVELVQSLEGHEHMPILPCDVGSDSEIEQCFAALGEKWGKLDVLVHSIAYARTEDLHSDFINVSREGYRIAQEISAWSLIACARGAKPLMEAAGGGSIFTLSYLAAERVVDKYNIMAPAKAALECNVRYLATDLGPSNIRVNAISAGPIKTLASSAVKGVSLLRNVVEERAPLHRNVTIEEVGDVGLFLASNLSRCITGETIYADNGFNILGV